MLIASLVVFVSTFILGTVIGSFLNVVVERGEKGAALTGRSHCDTCGTTLSWRELVPLASFVYQKGRCLHCGTVLSVQYLLIEIGTGLVFAAVAGSYFFDALVRGDPMLFVSTLVLLAVVAAMIVIIVADFNYHIIPNGPVLFLFISGIVISLVRNGIVCVVQQGCVVSWSALGMDVAMSICTVAFFFALWFLSKGRAMGFGDVKLIGVTSLLLGFPLSLVAFVFAFWLGGIAGVVLLLARTRGLKSEIAFGPFIIGGAVLAFFLGHAFLVVSGFSGFLSF